MTRSDRERSRAGWLRFCGAAAVLGLMMLARPPEATALKSCAAYVSGGANNPAFGSLVGSMTVEECAIIQGGIPGTGATYQRCITYEVGYYDLGGSTPVQLDCRSYSVWDR